MNNHNLTAEPITIPPTPSGSATQPPREFLRLPKPGRLCEVTGLSRAKLNELILPCKANNFRPPVKSFALRQRGATRGVRLIVYQSLMDYLRQQMQEQN